MDVAIVGVLGTVLGTLVGWLLHRQGVRDDRIWAEQQTVRQAQDAAASALDAALMDAWSEAPHGVIRGSDASPRLIKFHNELGQAWGRASLINDIGLAQCVNSLAMLTFMAIQDAAQAGQQDMNLWPLEVGVGDLRRALAAYQRHEELPEPGLPGTKRLIEISGGVRDSLDKIRDDLVARGVMS